MNITIEIDVFDNPNYCNSDTARCKYLERRVRCGLFLERLGFGPNPHRNFKCDQCKTAYMKAVDVRFAGSLMKKKSVDTGGR